jgi:hypothetical protein
LRTAAAAVTLLRVMHLIATWKPVVRRMAAEGAIVR